MKRAIVGQFASILGAIPVSRPQDNAVSCAGADPIRTLGLAWLGLAWLGLACGRSPMAALHCTAGTLSVVNGEYRVVGVGTRFTELEEKATLLLPGILPHSSFKRTKQSKLSCSANVSAKPIRMG